MMFRRGRPELWPVAALGLILGMVLTSVPVSARTSTPAPVGSDRFVPKRNYSGDFPDPDVLRVGKKWFAYATTIANLNLPVMSSPNLIRWKARKKSNRKTNDAMPITGAWAEKKRAGGRWVSSTWAPSVARVGKRYVLAYSSPVAVQPTGPGVIKKYCISLAYSKRPMGPFVDRRSAPLVCPADRGAIDADLFIDPNGAPWLYWKTEQNPWFGFPAQIYGQRLNARANGFAPGSAPVFLLQTQEPWEGILIENPSMVHYAGRYYLFFSGGSYANPTYATGYAICETQTGPCVRASNSPILTSGAGVDGPGGGSAFVDRGGRLRLAYAAWKQGNFGYPKTAACLRTPAGCAQRHLHVATLAVQPDGNLGVVSRG
jgi:beta-xylosidase